MGLMCPEGIIALIEEMSEDFIPLSPPSEGCLQAGRGPSSGNRIGQCLTWDFLASRKNCEKFLCSLFCFAAPG